MSAGRIRKCFRTAKRDIAFLERLWTSESGTVWTNSRDQQVYGIRAALKWKDSHKSQKGTYPCRTSSREWTFRFRGSLLQLKRSCRLPRSKIFVTAFKKLLSLC